MNYLNFDLEIFGFQETAERDTFQVRVAQSPAGEQRQKDADTVVVPRDLRDWMRRLDGRKLSESKLIEFGEMLTALLFPAKAHGFLDRSRARLKDNEGLRIRLRIDTFALADIPWEFAYIAPADTPANQKGINGFLALDRQISIVRHEVLGQPLGTLSPLDSGPLRMVIALANPTSKLYAQLDLASEKQNLIAALAPIAEIAPVFVDNTTRHTLGDALERNAHIFHFSGHGKFDDKVGLGKYGSTSGTGYLILEDAAHEPDEYPAEKLALSLSSRGIRLAMLGACEVGQRDNTNAWSGIVPALTRAGIPAVVGMQFSIRDGNAVEFSRKFYRALAQGHAIDDAVREGRLAIFNIAKEVERDWGVPVLYLRVGDTPGELVLFPDRRVAANGTQVVAELDAQPKPKSEPTSEAMPDARTLREYLNKHFSENDLETLCVDLSLELQSAERLKEGEFISLETVGGASKPAKILNLIQYLQRRSWLAALIIEVRKTQQYKDNPI